VIGELVALELVAPAVLAEAPRVVSSTPQNGAIDVDPDLSEVVVTWDAAMERGWSVAKNMFGSKFPKTDADDWRWQDDRTLVLPVSLVPDRDYALWLNSAAFLNFRSTGNVAATPFLLRFSTRPRAGAPRAGGNGKRFAALQRAIEDDYAHRDLVGVDWEAAFTAARPDLLAAPSVAEFGRLAGRLLAGAHDAHLALVRHGWNYLPDVTLHPNVALPMLENLVPNWDTSAAGHLATGRFPGGPSYLWIGDWSGGLGAHVRRVFAAVAAADPESGLIVDVRGNSGGDEHFAQEVAGCFAAAPTPYAAVRVLEHGEWQGPFVNEVAPNPHCKAFPAARVVVLQGPAVMSSNESFLEMMHEVGAVTIGETSFGSSGRPLPHRIGGGLRLLLPSWIETRTDGTPTEGVGISPEIAVATTAADFDSGDPVLESAIRELARR
jgi:hypothetical protein